VTQLLIISDLTQSVLLSPKNSLLRGYIFDQISSSPGKSVMGKIIFIMVLSPVITGSRLGSVRRSLPFIKRMRAKGTGAVPT